MDKNKQTTWWVVGGAVVIIAAIWFIMMGRSSTPSSTPSAQTPDTSVSPTPATATPPVVKAPPSTAAYEAALKKYASSRIQFQPSCQIVPNSVTYRSPATIMLDNRSADTANITIGTTAYTVGPWNYKIVTLSSSTLPKTDYVSCNAAKNSGTILLQK